MRFTFGGLALFPRLLDLGSFPVRCTKHFAGRKTACQIKEPLALISQRDTSDTGFIFLLEVGAQVQFSWRKRGPRGLEAVHIFPPFLLERSARRVIFEAQFLDAGKNEIHKIVTNITHWTFEDNRAIARNNDMLEECAATPGKMIATLLLGTHRPSDGADGQEAADGIAIKAECSPFTSSEFHDAVDATLNFFVDFGGGETRLDKERQHILVAILRDLLGQFRLQNEFREEVKEGFLLRRSLYALPRLLNCCFICK